MTQIMTALVSGVFGAGLFGLIQFLITRHDRKKAADSAETKALRYIMLYIIQERAKELIAAGEATLDEMRGLRKWHELYHNSLGGNGDADALMKQVDSLHIKMD